MQFRQTLHRAAVDARLGGVDFPFSDVSAPHDPPLIQVNVPKRKKVLTDLAADKDSSWERL